MTRQNLSQRISGQSSSSILFLLSGEGTGLPEAEARSLVLMLDPSATFSRPEKRLMIARTIADSATIEARVAFSRRVGVLVPGMTLDASHLSALRAGSYAIRAYSLGGRKSETEVLVERLAREVDGKVSLDRPDLELTIVRGEQDFLAITSPKRMRQGWVVRRPRARAFFHPAAIFPKLSRFLVNVSRVKAGEVFLDPFCGTGSLLIEAYEVGATPLGLDISAKMTRGALRNRDKFGQDWAGVARADAKSMPVRRVDAVATDIPYGRASSTEGSSSKDILEALVSQGKEVLGEGRMLVVMHPKSLEVPETSGFELEEQHHLYIHRKLTRSISVLRRV